MLTAADNAGGLKGHRNWSGRLAMVLGIITLALVAAFFDLAGVSAVKPLTRYVTGWQATELLARIYLALFPFVAAPLGMVTLLASAVGLKGGPRSERVESVVGLAFLTGATTWTLVAWGHLV